MAVSGTITNVRISGIACAVPEKVLSNEVFATRFGAEQMQKFEKMVGVCERHVAAADEFTSDFACKAARRLKIDGLWTDDDVDAVVFVSQTPDFVLPATACAIQHRLGIKKDCIAFDINLGCSGFVYGVHVASSLLQMDGVRKVLLLGGDCCLKTIDPGDASAAPLFGDSGFATVFERADKASAIDYAFRTDGSGYGAIMNDNAQNYGRHNPPKNACTKMDGMDVFNFTINEVPELIKEQMCEHGVKPEKLDYLVLHQANKFVLKQVAMITDVGMAKTPISMDRYGNTSSSSIPLTLCDLAVANPGLGLKKVLMSGFGVGLSWGTLLMDFDFSCCHGIEIGADKFKED